MPIFKGAGVAIVTPMKENLEVNYELLERNINYQIDNGTDAHYYCRVQPVAVQLYLKKNIKKL